MTTIPATDLESLITRVKAAQKQFATFTQEQVDLIFRKAAFAAAGARIPLAKLAVEETHMGLMEDKVVKNHFASEYIYNKYKDERTCGILEEDKEYGTLTIAEPVGLICAIVPTTNPTSTAIFKALISLKTRNGIIFCPHPRAARATCEAARIVHEAAVAAGAPEGIIAWVEDSLHGGLQCPDAPPRHQPDPGDRRAGHGQGGLFLRETGNRRRRRQHPGGDRRVRRHQARGRLDPDVEDLRQRCRLRVGAVGDRGGTRLRRRTRPLRPSRRLYPVGSGGRGRAQGAAGQRRAERRHRRPDGPQTIAELAGIDRAGGNQNPDR